jgi:hypothetical protein
VARTAEKLSSGGVKYVPMFKPMMASAWSPTACKRLCDDQCLGRAGHEDERDARGQEHQVQREIQHIRDLIDDAAHDRTYHSASNRHMQSWSIRASPFDRCDQRRSLSKRS